MAQEAGFARSFPNSKCLSAYTRHTFTLVHILLFTLSYLCMLGVCYKSAQRTFALNRKSAPDVGLSIVVPSRYALSSLVFLPCSVTLRTHTSLRTIPFYIHALIHSSVFLTSSHVHPSILRTIIHTHKRTHATNAPGAFLHSIAELRPTHFCIEPQNCIVCRYKRARRIFALNRRIAPSTLLH